MIRGNADARGRAGVHHSAMMLRCSFLRALRRARLSFAVFAALLATAMVTMGAAQAQSPTTGLRVAARWCSGCHPVDGQPPRNSNRAPTWSQIAARPWTEAKFIAALSPPHPELAQAELSRQDFAELYAFIQQQH